MMRIPKTLAISLLLTFLAFSIYHIPKAPPNQDPDSKTSIFFNDWKVKAQWDDEKKPINLPNFFVIFFILSTIRITVTAISTNFKRDTSFLIPIFHQSNYLIHTPKL
ncbi:hypothetical protein [Neobacillus mesonae]|uniref:hypothetical protein n=1 Tax=Neobacillus mesonae TaxID=1193713 RepID=UPI00203FB47D|nr:hypothetical protein [Neobacillus mesonae]MCM3570468.1 hypothetical protein [Neobacillus mesonae]